MCAMEILDPAAIQSVLKTQVFGRHLVLLSRTGSTNDVARRLARQDAPEGTVVLAEEQTAGRGRMDRRWMAPPGTCLLCSILFRPSLPPDRAQRLTMLCSMAAADGVEHVSGLAVALKWPNDLIIPSVVGGQEWKKLAGVLTETGMKGARLDYVVVGIGINVNVEPGMLPALAPDATSILAETGRFTERVALVSVFLAEVERRYQALRVGISPHQEWAARLATLGRQVGVTTAKGVLTGVAEAVDEDGALLLRTPDGVQHRFMAGDVTLDRP